jgi:hypothetical protein
VCQGRLRASHTKPTKIVCRKYWLSNKNKVYRIKGTQKYQKITKNYKKLQTITKKTLNNTKKYKNK